jgi:hypothetical protein
MFLSTFRSGRNDEWRDPFPASRHSKHPNMSAFNLIFDMGALPSFCGGVLNSVVVEGIVHWVEHHIITGKCQILRICGDNQNSHDGDMSYRFSRALVRSRVMDATKKFITDFKECSFDPDLAAATVMSSKKINPEKEKLCTANLKLCFLSIIGTNRVIRDILVLKDTVFSYDTIDHANLLDALWTEMFPDIRRSTPGLISNEWCADFGFQNSNPSSDFRGMGIFGLHQLEYFARTFPVEARALLMQCQNPSIDRNQYDCIRCAIDARKAVTWTHFPNLERKCIINQLNAVRYKYSPWCILQTLHIFRSSVGKREGEWRCWCYGIPRNFQDIHFENSQRFPYSWLISLLLSCV